MSEDSSSHFLTVEYGEWETVGDRITRRRVTHKRTEQWHWQYRIERNYQGQVLTAYVDVIPEIVSDPKVCARYLRDRFLECMASHSEEIDPWTFQ
jgi:hypothetical protein